MLWDGWSGPFVLFLKMKLLFLVTSSHFQQLRVTQTLLSE